MIRSKPMLYAIVTLAGATTMAVEMAGARLLDPYFGNSLIIWASLIGLIMIYLSAGYYLGGRLADRRPEPARLYQLTLWAAFAVGLIPFVSRPVLRFAAGGLAGYEVGLLAGSLLGVLALFSIPIVLLGCVSPFAIRLVMREVSHAGDTSGKIYALSTIGSIFGTFLPVLLFIPNLGTRATFLLASFCLLVPSLLALLHYLGARGLPYVLLPLILAALLFWQGNRPIKEASNIIYETESAYNYIQVVDIDGTISLKLNEGEGIHSVYHPTETMTFATWDYFLIAPFFNDPPYDPARVDSLCMVGLAAGTIPKLYTAAYGPIWIDGAEIDPVIIDIGRRFFDMREPNLHAYAVDGRRFLADANRSYDVIAVDAYRPPYIPFHLTTREFFELARSHLTPEGVVAINVARTADDSRLVDALASTMRAVFPSVYIFDEPMYGEDLGNALVIATNEPTRLSNFDANLPLLQGNQLLSEVAGRARPYLSEARADGIVFTDDRAPVEQVMHALMLRYALEGS